MSHDGPWLTTEGAAVYANCSLTTIKRAIKRGDLRATRLNHGRIYRVHKEWIDRWLNESASPEREGSTHN